MGSQTRTKGAKTLTFDLPTQHQDAFSAHVVTFVFPFPLSHHKCLFSIFSISQLITSKERIDTTPKPLRTLFFSTIHRIAALPPSIKVMNRREHEIIVNDKSRHELKYKLQLVVSRKVFLVIFISFPTKLRLSTLPQ